MRNFQLIKAMCLFGSAIAGFALHYFIEPLAVVGLFSAHIVFAGVCISILTGIVVVLIPTQYRYICRRICVCFD